MGIGSQDRRPSPGGAGVATNRVFTLPQSASVGATGTITAGLVGCDVVTAVCSISGQAGYRIVPAFVIFQV